MKYFALIFFSIMFSIFFKYKILRNEAFANEDENVNFECDVLSNEEDTLLKSLSTKGNDSLISVDPILEFIEFEPVIKNSCTNDRRLYIRFRLIVDTIINDTLQIKKISIVDILDENHKFKNYKECNDDLLNQLYAKTYIYRGNAKIRRVVRSCVALK